MPKIVGIDLGTTNSVIAIIEGDEPTVITLSEGSRLCPSVVGFTKSGEILVGQLARRQALVHPERTISSVKRSMGSRRSFEIDEASLTPQEISAIILRKLKADAEAYLGEPIEHAVITVPAYFTDAQRQATKDAGTIAGLQVVRIINEPTAAALAYGIRQHDPQKVLVWDLGGGTFDVSILEITEGFFEVRATCGDTRLGGDDWDERIVERLASEFEAETGVDLRRDKLARQRLADAAEKAKIELSTLSETNVNLPFISSGVDGPLHLDINLSRSQLEQVCYDLVERLIRPTNQALKDSGLQEHEIDRVLLVGGATRMPSVQNVVRKIFGKEPYRGLNPDEAVALGAALQAGVISKDLKGLLLLDVTPLTLGIETFGGSITTVLERNTPIPAQGRQMFTTSRDDQTSVTIRVYQGEAKLAEDNVLLAEFQLAGIEPGPRGSSKVEVTFDVDVNGIVHVTAVEQSTGQRNELQITTATGLAGPEIERMRLSVTQR